MHTGLISPRSPVRVRLPLLCTPQPPRSSTVPTSQNGWPANDYSLTTSIVLPGGKLRVRSGDVAVIMGHLALWFHENIEPLVWPGNWGYAERPIRGSSTTLSNHASGTAIDLNAPEHPLGARGTFTDAQTALIRKKLSEMHSVIRWGGDYVNRADEMHFEINLEPDDLRVPLLAHEIAAGQHDRDTTISATAVRWAAEGRPLSGRYAMDAQQFMAFATVIGAIPRETTLTAWLNDRSRGNLVRYAIYRVNYLSGHPDVTLATADINPNTAAFMRRKGGWVVTDVDSKAAYPS